MTIDQTSQTTKLATDTHRLLPGIAFSCHDYARSKGSHSYHSPSMDVATNHHIWPCPPKKLCGQPGQLIVSIAIDGCWMKGAACEGDGEGLDSRDISTLLRKLGN